MKKMGYQPCLAKKKITLHQQNVVAFKDPLAIKINRFEVQIIGPSALFTKVVFLGLPPRPEFQIK